MHLSSAPLSLAILVATAGIATAAPPPEDLPVRPPHRRNVTPDQDPAASSPHTETEATGAATSGKGRGKPACTSCTPQVPTCKPKWEDKKTKKASLAIKCDFECVRPWEPYHDGACCEEKTTPCGEVRTKKKLYKTEEEKVERVLKYEVVMKPAAPCCDPEPSCRCFGCRCFGPTVARIFGGCH